MEQSNANEWESILQQIKSHAATERLRLTQHAHQEMGEEAIRFDEVLQAIQNGGVLEYYPEHKRGPCCLLNGQTKQSRWLHLVCTTAQPLLILITVYEPKPPKWITPTQRGRMP